MCNVTFIYLSRALLPSRAMVAKQEQVKRTMGIILKMMMKDSAMMQVPTVSMLLVVVEDGVGGHPLVCHLKLLCASFLIPHR